MPIKQGDLQLLASRVMDDVPEGGAGPSAIVIEDGKSNASSYENERDESFHRQLTPELSRPAKRVRLK